MKLPGSIKNGIVKDKNGKNAPHLEINEMVLVHCNSVNNDKSFGSLLEISQKKHIVLKTFNSEFETIEVWFTDQNSQPLEIEDKFNSNN